MYPESIKNLIESFKYLPGIGEKTAERLAFSVIELEEEQIKLFSSSLLDAKKRIHKCNICNSLTEDEICYVCSDNTRDSSVLCVVDDYKSVFLFERLGKFNINPEDIGLDKLLNRVKNEKFKEIIFAFKPSIEGETTALYIKRVLDGLNIKITRLASGVPIGADIEYVDSLTLERALSDRKLVE